MQRRKRHHHRSFPIIVSLISLFLLIVDLFARRVVERKWSVGRILNRVWRRETILGNGRRASSRLPGYKLGILHV